MTTTSNLSGPSGIEVSSQETPAEDSSNPMSPETAAVIVAVIVPVVVIAIVVLCFFQIQKHWKMRQAQAIAAAAVNAGSEPISRTGDAQLYLQHKAELSVERTGYEIQLAGEVHELTDRDLCQEMPGEEVRLPMLSLGERFELRGEDPAMELDSARDRQDSRQDIHRYGFDEPVFVDFNESVLSLHDFA